VLLSGERLAIYFAPAEGSLLARLAAEWFAQEDVQAHTVSPRHYGFHATLKPPFALAEGVTAARVRESVAAFAAGAVALRLPALEVSLLGNFIALTLREPSAELTALAGRIVEHFDAFRRPPTEEELEQRRRAKLNERQLELLERWGYPYVMEQWQFHMTLTSNLTSSLTSSLQEAGLREELHGRLREHFGPALAEPVWMEDLSVFWQPDRATAFTHTDRFACSKR
jgi:hypothetical protein